MKSYVPRAARASVLALLALLCSPTTRGVDASVADAVANLNAYAAYKSGDYAQARKLWRALAARGNTTAMNNLANMFDQGQGTARNSEVSVRWLRKAAEAGDRIAQLNLGLAYEDGRGVTRDNRTAAKKPPSRV